MASLAGMLQQRGHKVTGSDSAVYPPMSDFLAALGITVSQPYSERNLEPRPDLVIVGNAISRGNPELERVLDERLPFASLPQVLYDEFLRGRERLVVAGTHGKTTTTSMLAWIFQVAGRSPSFLIGGIAENFGTSFQLGSGPHFLLEGDEYDTAFFDKAPKFLHYLPDAATLTSVEFDHADIYRDLDAVKTAFRRLVNLVPRRGRVVAYDGSPNVDDPSAPGHKVHETPEGGLDRIEVAINIGMVEFDRGQGGSVRKVMQELRPLVEEGGVIFVALEEEVRAAAELKAGPEIFRDAADKK